MKKSQVLHKLSRLLNLFREKGNNLDSNNNAKLVLNLIESEGMVPQTPSKLIKPKGYRWGLYCTMRCVCEECCENYITNKWEIE